VHGLEPFEHLFAETLEVQVRQRLLALDDAV
jgi:hypothetical protein